MKGRASLLAFVAASGAVHGLADLPGREMQAALVLGAWPRLPS